MFKSRNYLKNTNVFLAALLAAPALGTMPALALTGDEVLNKLSGDESVAFIWGAVGMASHLHRIDGNADKAQCINDWFYATDDAFLEAIAILELHTEKSAVGLIDILIDHKCGE